MDFWDQFTKESLQSPWMIMGESLPSNESGDHPMAPMVFLVSDELDAASSAMVSKMIGALNLGDGKIQCLIYEKDLDQQIMMWPSKKIIFFGSDLPGAFGQWLNWQGHQIINTHGLKDLMAQPDLKKETWAHLKLFAGMQ